MSDWHCAAPRRRGRCGQGRGGEQGHEDCGEAAQGGPGGDLSDELRRVFALLHDTQLPVRSGGLCELRRLVFRGLGEHFDAAFDTFAAHIAEDDSALFLPAVMGLAALADADPPRALPLIIARYAPPPDPAQAGRRAAAARRRATRAAGAADAGLLPDAVSGSVAEGAGGAAPRAAGADRRHARDRAAAAAEEEEATLLKLADCLVYCAWRAGEALPQRGAGFVAAFIARAHHREPAAVRASALWSLGFVAGQLRWAAAPEATALVSLARDVLAMDRDVLCRRAAAGLLQQLMCGLRHDAVEALGAEVVAEILGTARRLLHGGDPVVGEYTRLLLEAMNDVKCDIMLQPRRGLCEAPPPQW